MKKILYPAILASLIMSCGEIPEETETTEEPVVECGLSETVSYKTDVVPILEANCYSCHNEEDYGHKADGHKLYTYESIKEEADEGDLVGSILHQKGYIGMPYRKEKIDTCDLAVIIKWVEQGAPNN